MVGVPLTQRVLWGTVAGLGPDVPDDIEIGHHVIFRRPEGELPELAFMDYDLILGRLEYPDYG